MKGVEFGGFERIVFEDISFSYEAEGPGIFKDLSFEVPMGKNVFVTGLAGGGQSTFLKLVSVLLQPQSGRVFINDYDVTELSFEEFLPIRMRVGYSFDYGGLLANRTLRENLTLPLLYHNICSADEANQRAEDWAEQFSFSHQQHQRPAMVSGGLRKLICVLRAFMMSPELVALDDPFTGMGHENSKKIIKLIRDRRETGELKHVFLTSRDENWVHELGCESLVIEHDKIRFLEKEGAA